MRYVVVALAFTACKDSPPPRPILDLALTDGFAFGKTTEAEIHAWSPNMPVARDRHYGGTTDVRYDGKPAIHFGIELAGITEAAGYVSADHFYLTGDPAVLTALSSDAHSLCVKLERTFDDNPRTHDCPAGLHVDAKEFESPLWTPPRSSVRWCVRGPNGKGTVVIECRHRDGDDAIYAWYPDVEAP